MAGKLFFGTSGLVLPVPNKTFYPELYRSGTRLHYYASLYNSIEVNSTFYKLPRKMTVEKWAAEVTGEFKFTFKFPSTVSHAPGLAFDRGTIDRFMDIVNAVGEKKGCLLLQFPRKLTADSTPRLAKILNHIRSADNSATWKLVLEFRDISWYSNRINKMLQRFDAFRVIHDWHTFKTPLESDADIVYVRFHGPEKGYRGTYGPDELSRYASAINAWLKEGKDVYLYFNNTLGTVSADLHALLALLAK